MHLSAHSRIVRLATAYDSDDEGEVLSFTLPEDFASLPDEEIAALREQATEAFNALYETDEDLSADAVEAMTRLADAVDALRTEETRREEERAANRSTADDLAQRVNPDDPDAGGEPDAGTEAEAEPEGEAEAEAEPEAVAASGTISISLPGVRRRQRRRAPTDETVGMPAILASADLGGVPAGEEITVDEVAEQLIRKTQGMTEASYRAAYNTDRRVQHSIGLLSIQKNFPQDLVASADNGHEVLGRAVDESRLPGGSLVAAGGWCSPSETTYELFELESADGLVSIPEFQVIRGGIRWTRGPDFSSLFAATGFSFDETADQAGDYDGYGGDKPCFKVECPEFTEERLQVTGLCVTAGILQNRAYPEVTARTIRGALVGHQHRLAAQTINALVADSTAVAWPANQAGALAPLLTAIEAQATHYRYVHRMADTATLEAIFPRWVRGVIRADLSRRLGVDLLTVSNQQIQGWFSERGINPQFVYNYQDITGDATAFTGWPAEVSFLLYAAGTWARGSSDVISLDAIFDSALLTQNDFTALFSEEGWLVARRGHDSRQVTVPICADGATHGGIAIECDGTVGA